MKKYIAKYGVVNCIIAAVCTAVLFINSIVVDKHSLFEISENITAAYIINFIAGCQGILGKWGSMSYEKAIWERQLWRCFTHIYLHAGLIHMVMNMSALLIAGKYVEKRYGSIKYACFFHGTAVVDAVIVAFIFQSESVGASAGIFATIGAFLILLGTKQISVKKSEIIFLFVFGIISLCLGMESLIIHLIALILGVIFGGFCQVFNAPFSKIKKM